MKLLTFAAACLGSVVAMPMFMTSVDEGLQKYETITQKICHDKSCSKACQATPLKIGKCMRASVGSFTMACSEDGTSFNQTQYSDSRCQEVKGTIPGQSDTCYQAGFGTYVEFTCDATVKAWTGSVAPKTPKVIANVIAPVAANGHYGDPLEGNCLPDEVDISIQGLSGSVCAPSCGFISSCPRDLPTGVTATPQCALQDASSGKKYCALICSPELPIKDQDAADDQCGEKASCKPISGVGLCTYDS